MVTRERTKRQGKFKADFLWYYMPVRICSKLVPYIKQIHKRGYFIISTHMNYDGLGIISITFEAVSAQALKEAKFASRSKYFHWNGDTLESVYLEDEVMSHRARGVLVDLIYHMKPLPKGLQPPLNYMTTNKIKKKDVKSRTKHAIEQKKDVDKAVAQFKKNFINQFKNKIKE